MKMKSACSTAGLIFTLLVLSRNETVSANGQKQNPCSAAVFRQFDFWAGNWDVFENNQQAPIEHARVDPILEGCVLREAYQQSDGHKGQSFTIYDASRNVWHQTWVTSRGELLQIEGQLEGNSIVMTGTDHAKGSLVRGTWTPEQAGVREVAVISADQGNSWKPWFDINFRRAQAQPDGMQRLADIKIIKDLDTRYQAAVKINDVVTMEHMLADNFTLVTGSGKIYSKDDLLEEARSGRVQYERQDDTDQAVRIWGDTAVLTARLTEIGTEAGKAFDYEAWFSDTYVQTAGGWKYVFGQSSLPMKNLK